MSRMQNISACQLARVSHVVDLLLLTVVLDLLALHLDTLPFLHIFSQCCGVLFRISSSKDSLPDGVHFHVLFRFHAAIVK